MVNAERPEHRPLPLGVLDLSPVPSGSTGADALRNTLDLALHAERLGYRRYWLAEHHATPGLASSAPEIMIGRIAAATTGMRVGAGGIMLPNHAPLRIAESFRVLEALHPGRIDLGIGRAPGADPVTAFALRRTTGGFGGEEFTSQIAELLAYAGAGFPDDHPFRNVRAVPDDVPLPPLWMLGTSDESARLAAALGMGYAFARHLGPRRAEGAMRLYREEFRPSRELEHPRSILAASVFCADTEARAEELAGSLGLWVVRARGGRPTTLPSPEEAAGHDYGEAEAQRVAKYRRAQVIGSPEQVRDELDRLAVATQADELMVMTSIHDHSERLRSYELLAGAFSASSASTVTDSQS